MDCLELNPAQEFEKWEANYLQELETLSFRESLGNMLLFEDDAIRLWNLRLEAGQRLPFMRHNKNFSWISETDAILKSRFGNGRISLIRIKKGETEYFKHQGKNLINDLENLGDAPAIFKVLEYKHTSHDLLPILN